MIHVDIIQLAKENTNYRKVVYTGAKIQLVLMSIPVGGTIGMETHESTDQLLFFVEGKGEAILNGKSQSVGPNDVVSVAAGTEHNFVNKGENALKLYTVYAPPNHPDGIVEATKKEADEKEPEK